jgi:ABC-type glycerol-3-phosphate transport system substrate-binding protein
MTSSRNAASAFRFLAWLASAEVSGQFARAGQGTMPVRRSLANSPQWYESQISPSERTEIAGVLASILGGERCLIVPRVPGVDEYLLLLAEAVEDTVFEAVESAAALEKAAASWELITERRGREKQRQAYRRHLGISDL